MRREVAVADKARLGWATLRELHEGAAPTLERLAAASGRTVAAVRSRAKREAWGELFPAIADEDPGIGQEGRGGRGCIDR